MSHGYIEASTILKINFSATRYLLLISSSAQNLRIFHIPYILNINIDSMTASRAHWFIADGHYHDGACYLRWSLWRRAWGRRDIIFSTYFLQWHDFEVKISWFISVMHQYASHFSMRAFVSHYYMRWWRAIEAAYFLEAYIVLFFTQYIIFNL